MLGAVNTVEFVPGAGMRGHNTDGRGFVIAIDEAFGSAVKGLSVLILGSGGAGRGVAVTCAAEGAKQITVSDMAADRADRLAEEITGLFPHVPAEPIPANSGSWTVACRTADLVVQATPVGMKQDDPSLLEPAAFREGQMVFDLVYMYPETALMKAAQDAGAAAANGLSMLLHQGAHSFRIWKGTEPDTGAMRKALEDEVYG